MSSVTAPVPGTAEAVGRRIRALRETLGLSQTALGTRMGHSQAAVSNWENGTRSPDVVQLVRLAEALEVAVADLFPTTQAPAAIAGPFDVPLEVVPLVHTLAQHRALGQEDVRLNAAVDAAMTMGFRLGVAHGLREAASLIDELPGSATTPEIARHIREQHADWQARLLDQLGYDLGHHLAPTPPHAATSSGDAAEPTAP